MNSQQFGYTPPSAEEWVLVPREPSAEMLDAAIDAHKGFAGEDEVDAVWAAMLKAAPTPPAEAQGEGGVAELPAKWRAASSGSRAASSRSRIECADELEAALSAQPRPASAPVGVDLRKRALTLLHAEYDKPYFAGNYEDAAVDAIEAALAHSSNASESVQAQPAAVDGEHTFALQELADNEGHESYINATDAAALRHAVKAITALAQQPATDPSAGALCTHCGLPTGSIVTLHADRGDQIAAAKPCEAALSHQPAAVDEAMERLHACPKLWYSDLVGEQISQLRMRAIVTAALAQPRASLNEASEAPLLKGEG